MSVVERIFQEPELKAEPPVLVDVGAAGGVNRVWRTVSRYSIGVGFEPDARDAVRLSEAHRLFSRWIYCEGLVAPSASDTGRKYFYLTESPHCSSLLKPRIDCLQDWLFADLFNVQKIAEVPAVSLSAALAANGIERVDWLKCDTQGLDLSIYLSLPEAWRHRMLAVEFEPGIIDAYEGEDKLAEVLAVMGGEPFWLAELEINGTPRGRAQMFNRHLGARALRWVRRLAPTAAAWGNVRYLRDFSKTPTPLDRRAHLLGWVFATITEQHGAALGLAEAGVERFNDPLFREMVTASVRSLRWSMVRRLPGWVWRRLTLGR